MAALTEVVAGEDRPVARPVAVVVAARGDGPERAPDDVVRRCHGAPRRRHGEEDAAGQERRE